MALTTEEKLVRKNKREARRKELARKFPGCHYAPRDIQIICDEGWEGFLRIRTNHIERFTPDSVGGINGWVSAYVPLDDIAGLAKLVAALTGRLNALIARANEDILKSGVEVLQQVPTGKLMRKAISPPKGGILESSSTC